MVNCAGDRTEVRQEVIRLAVVRLKGNDCWSYKVGKKVIAGVEKETRMVSMV